MKLVCLRLLIDLARSTTNKEYTALDNNHYVTELHKLENSLNALLQQDPQQLLAQAIRSRCSILA
ncbi:hypothetical protein [Candidatus Enterovibrio escicola]|nr:hypothetical protein [Candidatus Enterovibrio escacola]